MIGKVITGFILSHATVSIQTKAPRLLIEILVACLKNMKPKLAVFCFQAHFFHQLSMLIHTLTTKKMSSTSQIFF